MTQRAPLNPHLMNAMIPSSLTNRRKQTDVKCQGMTIFCEEQRLGLKYNGYIRKLNQEDPWSGIKSSFRENFL